MYLYEDIAISSVTVITCKRLRRLETEKIRERKSIAGIKQKSHSLLSGFCSPSWARTRDPLINSQVL